MTGVLSAMKNKRKQGWGSASERAWEERRQLSLWRGGTQVEGRAVAEVQRQEDARPSPNSWSWKTAAPRGSMSGADSSSGRPGALSEQS